MSNTSLIDDADISFSSPNRSSDFLLDSEDTLVGYNRKIIRYYLENNENNIVKVAKKLDIGKSTIYRMMKNNEL